MGRSRRHGLAVVLPVIVVAAITGFGWRWWHVREYRAALARINDSMQHGRYAAATRDLSTLLTQRPDSDQALYLLGTCEKVRGRLKEAAAAWARIPPDSSINGRAVLSRVDLLNEQGRLADSEQLIESAAEARGADGSALRMLQIPNFVQEGRLTDAERLIESRWRSLNARGEGATEQAINLARLHIELRSSAPPIDATRAYLEHVGRLAPNDDRIWLGGANLATRAGAYDDAARWLKACRERRPDDQAVWEASLEWATKAKRIVDARSALKHPRASSLAPAAIHRLSAWFASACGDGERERRELKSMVAVSPEDLEGQERLEKWDSPRGPEPGRVETSAERASIDRAQSRYRDLYKRNQPARDALEMSRVAKLLGRRFEAIAFLTAAMAEEPARPELRAELLQLEQAEQQAGDTVRRLIDALPGECATNQSGSGTKVPASSGVVR